MSAWQPVGSQDQDSSEDSEEDENEDQEDTSKEWFVTS